MLTNAPSPPVEHREHLLRGLRALCNELQVTFVFPPRPTPLPGQPCGSRFVVYCISKKLLQKEGQNTFLLITWHGSVSMFKSRLMAKFDVLITHVDI